jgi:hypothetical protein
LQATSRNVLFQFVRDESQFLKYSVRFIIFTQLIVFGLIPLVRGLQKVIARPERDRA